MNGSPIPVPIQIPPSTVQLSIPAAPEFLVVAVIVFAITLAFAVIPFIFRSFDLLFQEAYERNKHELAEKPKRKRKNGELVTGDGERLEVIHESHGEDRKTS